MRKFLDVSHLGLRFERGHPDGMDDREGVKRGLDILRTQIETDIV